METKWIGSAEARGKNPGDGIFPCGTKIRCIGLQDLYNTGTDLVKKGYSCGVKGWEDLRDNIITITGHIWEIADEGEDKQKILDLLLPALQATRGQHDLRSLTYVDDGKGEQQVVIVWDKGKTSVNVSMDSGIAMIWDVLKAF